MPIFNSIFKIGYDDFWFRMNDIRLLWLEGISALTELTVTQICR